MNGYFEAAVVSAINQVFPDSVLLAMVLILVSACGDN
jgi:short subunit fatty acids transporter